jgi:pilus assembly protein CpaC
MRRHKPQSRDHKGAVRGSIVLLVALASAFAEPKSMTLMIGKGDLLRFNANITRVAVAEPKVADAIVVSPHEVMVNAKGLGNTTVMIWEGDEAPQRYDVNVVADTTDLDTFRKEMRAAFPGVTISGNNETLVLTGGAPDAGESKRIQALASTHAKTVTNLLQTPAPGEPRQILLSVRFASIDRVQLAELGFNLFSTNAKGVGSTSTQEFQQPRFTQLQFPNGGQAATPNVNFADLLNLFVFRPDLNLGATIRMLQSKNLLQILAEPNLICVEGKDASFLAGGQFPFPTINSTTTGGAISPVLTVQFKKFGVQLDFTPTITASGSINLKVAPEVSSLDFQNAVTVQGVTIPALSTRRAETEVILKDGETFAIAGLIDNRVTQFVNKVRGLGDIPILGQLFRSRSTNKSTEELLVVITPHLVRPLAAGESAKLPDILEPWLPSIAEQKAAKDKKKKGSKEPEFVGPRGHQQPK